MSFLDNKFVGAFDGFREFVLIVSITQIRTHEAYRFNQDIGRWDVTTMYSMFSEACDFNQDIGQWNVSQVTNMRGIILGATHIQRNLSQWDVRNVEDGNLFYRYRWNCDIC